MNINTFEYYVLRTLFYETKWVTRICYEPPNLHRAVVHFTFYTILTYGSYRVSVIQFKDINLSIFTTTNYFWRGGVGSKTCTRAATSSDKMNCSPLYLRSDDLEQKLNVYNYFSLIANYVSSELQ